MEFISKMLACFLHTYGECTGYLGLYIDVGYGMWTTHCVGTYVLLAVVAQEAREKA